MNTFWKMCIFNRIVILAWTSQWRITYIFQCVYIYVYWIYFHTHKSFTKLYKLKLNSFSCEPHALWDFFSVSNSFQINRNTIVVTVFLLIMNPTNFRLVNNQKENCNYDRIHINLKRIRKRFLWIFNQEYSNYTL